VSVRCAARARARAPTSAFGLGLGTEGTAELGNINEHMGDAGTQILLL